MKGYETTSSLYMYSLSFNYVLCMVMIAG